MSVVSLEEDLFLNSQDRARLKLEFTSCFVCVSGSWGLIGKAHGALVFSRGCLSAVLLLSDTSSFHLY